MFMFLKQAIGFILSFMEKFEPIDFIAIIIIVFGFFLMSRGVDSVVAGIVIMVSSYYFGKKSSGVVKISPQ